MSEGKRKHYTSEQKVAFLKEHWVQKKPLSEICQSHGIAVSQFYRWQEEFFARARGVFDSPRQKPQVANQLQEKIALLEARLQRKHEVLSELMEDHIALKKSLGEP